MFGVEVFLVPHYIIGMCAWYWSSVHLLLSVAILLHCMWTTQQEAKRTISYLSAQPRHVVHWWQGAWQLVLRFSSSVLACGMTVLLVHILWPAVPYFLCDWGLSIIIWHTALSLAFKPLKLLPCRRAQHIRRPQAVRQPRQDGIP